MKGVNNNPRLMDTQKVSYLVHFLVVDKEKKMYREEENSLQNLAKHDQDKEARRNSSNHVERIYLCFVTSRVKAAAGKLLKNDRGLNESGQVS